ncbi:hypothetical protein [Prochlorococcus sp. MIT 0702]
MSPSGTWEQLCRDGDSAGRKAHSDWHIHRALPIALKRQGSIH